MYNLSKLLPCFFILVFTAEIAWALNLGQALSSMGIIASRQREAENEVMRQRLLELQIQEANRRAIIQQIEFEKRIQVANQAKQIELQRQQQMNVEALRQEQAKIAEIHAAEQAQVAKKEALGPTQFAEIQTTKKAMENQKSMSAQLAEIADYLRKSSPRSLNNGVSLFGASVKDNKLFLSIKLEAIDVKSDSYKKVNDELLNQMSGAVVTTCLDQTLEPLTRQGAVVRYSFFDTKQSFIEGIDTDKTDCVELYRSK